MNVSGETTSILYPQRVIFPRIGFFCNMKCHFIFLWWLWAPASLFYSPCGTVCVLCFSVTVQTHTFKNTPSLIHVTLVARMWTVVLVSSPTCVCVRQSLAVCLRSRWWYWLCLWPWLPSTCVWNTVLMWLSSSMLSSRLPPAEQSISTNCCWRCSVSKPLCSSLATEMKSDC